MIFLKPLGFKYFLVLYDLFDFRVLLGFQIYLEKTLGTKYHIAWNLFLFYNLPL